jgi:NAD(P)-dependent dehydrogenase (short-subunit alcohol dehydrogenase family)
MRLEGKVAMITGAANGVRGKLMGFGGSAAWLFAGEGARVVVTDIDDEDGETTARQIRDSGREAVFVRLDVTSEREWEDAVRAAVSCFGRIDILVNNAGTSSRDTVEGTTVDMWDGQMEVHAKGAFLGTRAVIPEMRRVGGGSIINVSSIFSLIGSPSSTAYHAAKGAIRSFTKAAAVQYASEGIRVNSVHPGYVTTPMTQRYFTDADLVARRTESVPMKRFGTVEEIAYGMLYLASDEASYVTGADLVIDGGTTAV